MSPVAAGLGTWGQPGVPPDCPLCSSLPSSSSSCRPTRRSPSRRPLRAALASHSSSRSPVALGTEAGHFSSCFCCSPVWGALCCHRHTEHGWLWGRRAWCSNAACVHFLCGLWGEDERGTGDSCSSYGCMPRECHLPPLIFAATSLLNLVPSPGKGHRTQGLGHSETTGRHLGTGGQPRRQVSGKKWPPVPCWGHPRHLSVRIHHKRAGPQMSKDGPSSVGEEGPGASVRATVAAEGSASAPHLERAVWPLTLAQYSKRNEGVF